MSLYDEFNNLSIDSIHKYVKEGAAEDLQLEFKTVGAGSWRPSSMGARVGTWSSFPRVARLGPKHPLPWEV